MQLFTESTNMTEKRPRNKLQHEPHRHVIVPLVYFAVTFNLQHKQQKFELYLIRKKIPKLNKKAKFNEQIVAQ